MEQLMSKKMLLLSGMLLTISLAVVQVCVASSPAAAAATKQAPSSLEKLQQEFNLISSLIDDARACIAQFEVAVNAPGSSRREHVRLKGEKIQQEDRLITLMQEYLRLEEEINKINAASAEETATNTVAAAAMPLDTRLTEFNDFTEFFKKLFTAEEVEAFANELREDSGNTDVTLKQIEDAVHNQLLDISCLNFRLDPMQFLHTKIDKRRLRK